MQVAVQHERAPRSCIPNPHISNGLAAHLERGTFSSSQHMPLHHHHHNGLILPMPLHFPTAFSSHLDPQLQRHYSQFGSFHSNVFDSFSHFAAAANSNLFPPPPPPLIPGGVTMPSKTSLDPRDCSTMVPPLQVSSVFKSISTKTDSNDSDQNSTPIPPSMPTFTSFNHKIVKDGKEDEVSSSEEISTLQSNLLNGSSTTSSPQNDPDIVFETAAKLLFLAVKWTKSIPSFSQLNVNDQNLLLEECWAELFVIMSAQYGLPIASNRTFRISWPMLLTMDK